jgi:hypothetical protein
MKPAGKHGPAVIVGLVVGIAVGVAASVAVAILIPKGADGSRSSVHVDGGDGSPKAPVLSHAEAKAKGLAAHHASLAAHATEPRDSPWAQETEALLQKDLAVLAARTHASILSVDCRTRSCVATIGFASVADALQNARPAVAAANHVPCSSESALDDAEDAASPYPMTVVYECERDAH